MCDDDEQLDFVHEYIMYTIIVLLYTRARSVRTCPQYNLVVITNTHRLTGKTYESLPKDLSVFACLCVQRFVCRVVIVVPFVQTRAMTATYKRVHPAAAAARVMRAPVESPPLLESR